MRLKNLLISIDANIEVDGILPSILESQQYLEHHKPDLVFLDVQLSDGNAFDLLATTNIRCPIVFVTAYNSYIEEAFTHHAIDYLLKPIHRYQLIQTLNEITKIRPHEKIIPHHIPIKHVYHILVRHGNRFHVIKSNDIAYIYEKEGLTILVNYENETVPLNLSLKQIKDQLNDDRLICLSPDLIIHLDSIREILRLDEPQVELVIFPPPNFPLIFESNRIQQLIALLKKHVETTIY